MFFLGCGVCGAGDCDRLPRGSRRCGGATGTRPRGPSAFAAPLSKCMPSSSGYQDLEAAQGCACAVTRAPGLTCTPVSPSSLMWLLFFFFFLRSILEKEGPRSLFRGLGPNLVGVAPSR